VGEGTSISDIQHWSLRWNRCHIELDSRISKFVLMRWRRFSGPFRSWLIHAIGRDLVTITSSQHESFRACSSHSSEYCIRVIVDSLLLVVVLGSFIHGQRPSVSIDAPREIAFFQPPVIRVTGLAPLQPITISVINGDPQRTDAASRARFVPDLSGAVDTSRSIANGDYEGIDPMGMFRRPRLGQQFPLSGTVKATVVVEDENGRALARRSSIAGSFPTT